MICRIDNIPWNNRIGQIFRALFPWNNKFDEKMGDLVNGLNPLPYVTIRVWSMTYVYGDIGQRIVWSFQGGRSFTRSLLIPWG